LIVVHKTRNTHTHTNLVPSFIYHSSNDHGIIIVYLQPIITVP